MMIRSPLLEAIKNIRTHFGTAAEPTSSAFEPDWENRPRWKQVHGTELVVISDPKFEAGEVDGFYTATSHPIGIVSADCLPILLAREDGKKVAAIHAGWRGLSAGILKSFETRLTRDDEDPRAWVAAIGPANRACCYEVEETLIHQFRDQFPHVKESVITPAYRKLDLAEIARAELTRIGLGAIEILPYCTFCHRDDSPQGNGGFTFHSFRREKDHLRQYSQIQRRITNFLL